MLDSLTMTSAITQASTMFSEFGTLVVIVVGIGLAFWAARLAPRLIKKSVR